jgi:phosphomevalonate kinase
MSSLDQLQPFNPLPRPITQINKTGLGSSAALTTSLTAALLSYLKIIDLPSSSSPTPGQSTSLDIVHALAQLSHCLAQGKIGSGFDVASAVYGSHAYRRFSPSMSTPHLPIVPSGLRKALVRDKWDQTINPLRLPKGLRLVLADVDAGTDTPSFVNKVLWWKVEEAEEAGQIWARLDKANGLLREHLEGMCALEEEEGYEQFMADSAGKSMEQVS